MPELPEIEVVKRSLYKTINKAKIISVKVNNKNLRYQIPNTFSKSLINENILKISRRSKYLIFYQVCTSLIYIGKKNIVNFNYLKKNMFKRIGLFLLTNIAVMILLSIVMFVLERYFGISLT